MATVTLAARPQALDLDLARTALVVVDMQNDFGSEGGMFHRAGIDISAIKAMVPRIAGVIEAARAAGIAVIYLKQQHTADLADAGGMDAPHYIKHQRMQLGATFPSPDGRAGRILVKDTWNTDIVPELVPLPGDIVVGKHRYSGFFQTDLDERLKAMGIKQLIVTGATTSICVESTVRDAMFRDYQCIVLSDCTAEPIAQETARSNHEASLLTIELLFGWVATSSDLIETHLPLRENAA